MRALAACPHPPPPPHLQPVICQALHGHQRRHLVGHAGPRGVAQIQPPVLCKQRKWWRRGACVATVRLVAQQQPRRASRCEACSAGDWLAARCGAPTRRPAPWSCLTRGGIKILPVIEQVAHLVRLISQQLEAVRVCAGGAAGAVLFHQQPLAPHLLERALQPRSARAHGCMVREGSGGWAAAAAAGRAAVERRRWSSGKALWSLGRSSKGWLAAHKH